MVSNFTPLINNNHLKEEEDIPLSKDSDVPVNPTSSYPPIQVRQMCGTQKDNANIAGKCLKKGDR